MFYSLDQVQPTPWKLYISSTLPDILRLSSVLMTAIKKRSASPVGLLGKPSPFHSSVTLFTSNAVSSQNDDVTAKLDNSSPVRRSKRIKLEHTEHTLEDQDETEANDESPPRRRKTRNIAKSAVASSSKVKIEEVEVKATVISSKTSKKSASPRKPKPIQQSLDVPHPAPPQWKETYDTIKKMRENIVAPVDTMGCDQAQLKEQDPKVQLQALFTQRYLPSNEQSRRFSTLVSLMLSSQTKDEVTDAAVSKLRDALGGSLTIEAMLQADDSTIASAIAKVGFWRRKTEYVPRTFTLP